MNEVTLCLKRGDGSAVPFLKVNAPDSSVQGLLFAVASLSRYLPLRVLIDDNVVTAFDITREGCMLKGTPADWKPIGSPDEQTANE